MNIEQYLDLSTLPLLTQLTFQQLHENKTTIIAISSKRSRRESKGLLDEYFALGLAIYLYRAQLKLSGAQSKLEEGETC